MDRGCATLEAQFPGVMKTKHKTILLWILPVVFLSLFYFYPLESILRLSFSRSATGFIGPFIDAVQSSSIQGVLGFTIWQAGLSTLVTLILGLPGAYLLARFNFPGKSLLRAITGVPFVMPTLVVAAGFNALLGSKGWVNVALMSGVGFSEPPIQFTNTLTAILAAHVFYNTTIVLRMVGNFWSQLDPKLNQAAQCLGANRWQEFTKITIPLLLPVITAATLLVFIFDFTSFGVILILGGPRFSTLEVEIYYQTITLFNLPLAAVLSILQLGCTLALTVIYTRLSSGISRPITQRTPEQTQRRLNTWKRRVFAGVVIGVLLVILTSPLMALASQSVYSLEARRDREGETNRGLTLDFYRSLSQNPQESLFYAPPSTAIGISLSLRGCHGYPFHPHRDTCGLGSGKRK